MNNDEHQLLQVECGAFLNQYLVYIRKSTDDAENQRNSIKYQRATNLAYAVRERLSIAPITLSGFCSDGVVAEHHSGFKESATLEFSGSANVAYKVERPKFYRMAELLAQRRFKGVIFLAWDRASRNKADDVILQKLMRLGVEVHFVLAQYDATSAGALHMDIDSAFAAHHSRVTSEKVRLTLAQSRREGLFTNKAPMGYLNSGTMARQHLDPVRAPIVRRLFELVAEERWSLNALTRWANDQGLTTPPLRNRRSREEMLGEDEDLAARPQVTRPPSPSTIHRVLTNPFYMGKVRGEGGEWVNSKSHEPLVEEALFWRVQSILSGRRVSAYYPKYLALPYRGLVRCACDRVFTPYRKKAWLYLSAHCTPSCANTRRSIPVLELEALLRAELRKVEVSAALFAALAHTNGPTPADATVQQRKIDDQERRAKRLKEDQTYLSENRLLLLRTGAYSAKALLEEEAKIAAELAMIDAVEANTPTEALDTFAADILTVAELIRKREELFDGASSADRDAIARILFSEVRYFESSADFVPKPAFKALFEIVPGISFRTPPPSQDGAVAGSNDGDSFWGPNLPVAPKGEFRTTQAPEYGLLSSPYGEESFFARNFAVCAGSARLSELTQYRGDIKALISVLSNILP